MQGRPLTAADKTRWLEALRDCNGFVGAACKAANLGKSTVYEHRAADEEFAARWDDIVEETTAAMEQEMHRRAVDGVTEPVVSAGKLVAHAQRYSDTLLIFALKSRRPEVYRDRVSVEHGGVVRHVARVDLTKLSDDELDQLEQLTAKATPPA